MDKYDPHGGRAYAHRRADEITAEFMDVGIGTEGGREISELPVVEGEYNREESPRRVWDDFSPPNFGYPEAKGQTYQLTSEQYAVNQVAAVRQASSARRTTAAAANWIFSDSTSGGRVAVEVARASGEVDGVRLPKEAYYVCRAMFRADPQVHIIGHWTYPAGTKKTVYVASNGDEVELFVNGKSLGRGKVSDRYLFTFPDVAWEPGEIKAVAYTRRQSRWRRRPSTPPAPPVALRLTPITGPGGLRADGSDVALIDVEAVDANGERCPTFQQRVDFDVEGPGRLARRLQQRQDQLDQQHLSRPGMRHQPRRRSRPAHRRHDYCHCPLRRAETRQRNRRGRAREGGKRRRGRVARHA